MFLLRPRFPAHQASQRKSPDSWGFVSILRKEVLGAELGLSDPLARADIGATMGSQRSLCGLFPDAAQTFV